MSLRPLMVAGWALASVALAGALALVEVFWLPLRVRGVLVPLSVLAAVARGVLVDGWLCVTAVTVDERRRRSGLATAVMAALGDWARDRGGHSCVLQVAASNSPALALYRRLGFIEHHRYHYRLGASG